MWPLWACLKCDCRTCVHTCADLWPFLETHTAHQTFSGIHTSVTWSSVPSPYLPTGSAHIRVTLSGCRRAVLLLFLIFWLFSIFLLHFWLFCACFPSFWLFFGVFGMFSSFCRIKFLCVILGSVFVSFCASLCLLSLLLFLHLFQSFYPLLAQFVSLCDSLSCESLVCWSLLFLLVLVSFGSIWSLVAILSSSESESFLWSLFFCLKLFHWGLQLMTDLITGPP